MKPDRLNAFTDGVIAIIITIMVLSLAVPKGASVEALKPLLPLFGAYVLSFINVGIYWNNHHHMLQSAKRVDGKVLWANLGLLFWLSLFPFLIRWIGEAGVTAMPVAAFGVVLLLAGLAYYFLERALIITEGDDSNIAKAVGSKTRSGSVSRFTPARLVSPSYRLGFRSSSTWRWQPCGLFPTAGSSAKPRPACRSRARRLTAPP